MSAILSTDLSKMDFIDLNDLQKKITEEVSIRSKAKRFKVGDKVSVALGDDKVGYDYYTGEITKMFSSRARVKFHADGEVIPCDPIRMRHLKPSERMDKSTVITEDKGKKPSSQKKLSKKAQAKKVAPKKKVIAEITQTNSTGADQVEKQVAAVS